MISVGRLKVTKEGIKIDSEGILIHFEGGNLPRQVFLGLISYSVRAYVPKPLRSFNCQKFGHLAKKCKEKRRCVVEITNLGNVEMEFNQSVVVVVGVTVLRMLDVRG